MGAATEHQEEKNSSPKYNKQSVQLIQLKNTHLLLLVAQEIRNIKTDHDDSIYLE